ncbi:MAG: 4-hydroxy-3-methylbut-2-enyl diphosphate reductase [Nitrospinae bacterium]|nr:4-hydroxy-3-methylbut-2-enyl diphosphate reductase [Nitrospinota bacterium]
MAEIKLAKTAGFCWGVKRAIDITLESARGKNKEVYTYGPLIHNPQLIKLLESKNIHVETDLDKLQPGSEVIIRTHGITPQKREDLKRHGLKISDATCPLVAKVQGMIRKYSRKGYTVVIVGDDGHAEVTGLKGFAETPVYVVASLEEAKKLPDFDKVFVAAQTTCDIENYTAITRYFREKCRGIEIGDTICEATDERQSEVIRLAKEVDAMVIVGGKNSANTTRLAAIAKEHGLDAYHIETDDELDLADLSKYRRIGVTAGASTPKWIIDAVVAKLAGIKEQRKPFYIEILGFFVKSNLFLAAGGAMLTYANMIMLREKPNPLIVGAAFCAIAATYLTNQLLRPKEIQKSQIRKYYYHLKYNSLFWGVAVAALAAGLILSFKLGLPTLAVYLAVVGFGATYGIDRGRFRLFVRLKDIPASKDIFVSLAWVMITVVLTYISAKQGKDITFPILITFGIAYTRSVLFDIRDIYADQVIGKEVMPMLVGKEHAKKTLYGVLLGISIICIIDLLMGSRGSLMAAYLLGVAYLLGFVYYNENKVWIHSAKFDFFLDMPYFIIGLTIYLLA